MGIEKNLGNNSRTLRIVGTVAYRERRLVESRSARPGTVAYYREKAQEMLKQAEAAATPQAKAELIALAENWHCLARTLEEPNW